MIQGIRTLTSVIPIAGKCNQQTGLWNEAAPGAVLRHVELRPAAANYSDESSNVFREGVQLLVSGTTSRGLDPPFPGMRRRLPIAFSGGSGSNIWRCRL